MLDDVRRLVPTQIRRSYAAKFGIVLLIIGLSVGLIGSAATVQITNEVQSSVNDDFETFADQEANTIEQWATKNKQTTRLVAQNNILATDDRTAMSQYLQRQRSQLDGVDNIHLVTFDGDVVASTAGQNASLSERPWMSEMSEVDNRQTSTVAMSDAFEVNNISVVGFVNRIRANSQRALVITYYTSSAASSFQGTNRTDGGFTYVVDSTSGTIEFDETGQNTLAEYDSPGTMDLVRETASAKKPVVETVEGNDVLGEDHVVALAPIAGTDWVVAVHAPRDAAYGFVTAVSRFGLLATIGGVLLITILGAVLGRNTASAIDRLTAKTQRMEEGDLSVSFEVDRIDNIGRLYEAFGSMRDALREQIQEAQQARQQAEQSRERTEMMNQHLVEKADDYSQVMRDVAAGDLTKRMDSETRNEAMEEIAIEFNQMVEEIEQTMETVKAFSTDVATSTEEVTASSEEVKSASEKVTESIQEISDGADRQNEQLQQVSEQMSGLSTTIEEIASSANEVAELSQRTAETGDDARGNAEEVIHEMEDVETEAEATVDAMGLLQDQMEEVEEITEFITDVAEQTNILALNANIEAARAGEAGEGFAVVADEVKSLAEETRQAAEEIDQLIEDIQGQTSKTAEEVRQTSTEVARSVEIVEDTVDSLEQIARYAQETNTGIQEISEATTEQASSTNQVVGMVDEAASISEQTSQESENVAAAAEEQTTALTEVTNSAGDLAQQASRLSTALERFDTETSGDGDGSLEDIGGDAVQGFVDEDDVESDTGSVEDDTESDTGGVVDGHQAIERSLDEERERAGGDLDDAGADDESDASPVDESGDDEAPAVDGFGADIVDEVLEGSATIGEPEPAFEDEDDDLSDESPEVEDASEHAEDASEPEADDLDGDAEGDVSPDEEQDEAANAPEAGEDDGEPLEATVASEDADDAIDEWLDAQAEAIDDVPDPDELDGVDGTGADDDGDDD